jgi:hypothetical protein
MPFLLRGFPLFLFLYRMWRRMPAKQRKQALWMAGRHGPRLARFAWRRARPRRV